MLEVDASLKGLEACLSQIDDDGNLRPVAFTSRGLRGAERNYPDFSSFKLELLALKWAVSEKFKAYTLGSHCIVFTDHNPLAHLKTEILVPLSIGGLHSLPHSILKCGTCLGNATNVQML